MPGPVFVSSTSAARRHGAFAVQRTPNAIVRAIGTGVAGIVAQFPWGPDGVVVTPSGTKDLIYKIAPPGMDHTGSGFLSVIAKGWPMLKFVRVLGTGAAPATATLSAGGTNLVAVAARYKGFFGNSLITTVSNAGDGDPNHFKLTTQVAGPSGLSTETLDNQNYSGTGPDSAPDLTNAYLVGSIMRLAAGRPANGSYTFSGGSDGAVSAVAYTGIAGTASGGVAAFEGDGSVRHVFADDPGAALRPAVNGALRQHAEGTGDRCVYMNGNPGQSLAQVASDVANYRSERAVYVDPWPYILDESGAKRLVPPSSFAASVGAQLSPSTSIAWKDPEVIAMLSGIRDLEVDRGNGAADNTDQGVATIIREDNGGFTFEAGVVTIAPNDPARRNHTRTRIGDYAAVSMVRSSRSFIDAPNVPDNQQGCVTMVTSFMESLVAAKDHDPNHRPHCQAYDIPELSTFNSQNDLDSGTLTIPVDMKTSSGIERLFFSIRYGESVVVRSRTG